MHGGVSFLHSDNLVDAIGVKPDSVERLSNVEFDSARSVWTVQSARSGRVLFSHMRRDECLEWERDNLLELLG